MIHQMAFYILLFAYWIRDGKFNTLGHFFFWLLVSGLGLKISWTFRMPQILKKRCNITLRITFLPTHPKLQKILSLDLHQVLPKCGNASGTQNGHSLILLWPLGFHNTSLDVTFSVQNLSFCWSIKSMS